MRHADAVTGSRRSNRPTQRRTVRRRAKRDAYSILARAVARFLRPHGWRVVLVGGGAVTQPPHYPSKKYDFTVQIVGSRQ